MLNDRLLEDYMCGFYGYGDYTGHTWLVGMEEGGGATESEIRDRLDAWEAGGRRELDDVIAFHRRTGLSRWFEPNPPLQSTWRLLIRMLMVIDGETPSVESARAFQGGRLGRIGGSNSIVELFPLPSPGKDRWHYDEWSALPELRSRSAYQAALKGPRVQHLWRRIQEHKPRLVVFYSIGDMPTWTEVSQCKFTKHEVFYLATKGETLFVVTKHPVSFGASNAYFDSAGSAVREILSGSGNWFEDS